MIESSANLPKVAIGGIFGQLRTRRLVVAIALLILVAFPGDLGLLTRTLVIDAYLQVSVFVALTLFLLYGAERVLRVDLGTVMRNARGYEVPIAALLGATPGCGGAVVVVAAYTAGNVRFGSMVAALTATMGDAAFLLIATRPDAAAIVLPLSFVVGVLTGWVTNQFFGYSKAVRNSDQSKHVSEIGRCRLRDLIFMAVAVPGVLLGMGQLLNLDMLGQLAFLADYVALGGVTAVLAVWTMSPLYAMTNQRDHPATRTAEETSFITIWVIGAFLAYDYAVSFSGLNLELLFDAVAPLLPLFAILVGFIPGCGPQVLVTAMYISGAIPFSAIVGNAIANDGDALFPAIALNPGAAVAATAVSAVPALFVAYGFYFLAPGFMN